METHDLQYEHGFHAIIGCPDRMNVRGKVVPAPEAPRRTFLRHALAVAGGAALARGAPGNAAGDPAILNLQPHSTGLGQPVVARGYALPSVHEKILQRRESPGPGARAGGSGARLLAVALLVFRGEFAIGLVVRHLDGAHEFQIPI